MGGGRYNYLYRQFEDPEWGEDLAAMRDRLTELGHHDAARETGELLRIPERLLPLWEAVEFVDSGDWSESTIADAVRAYRERRPPP